MTDSLHSFGQVCVRANDALSERSGEAPASRRSMACNAPQSHSGASCDLHSEEECALRPAKVFPEEL